MHIRSSCKIQITKEKVEYYAELSGDTNAIHLDEKEAKHNGYAKPIAHGLLSMGLAMEVVSNWLDENFYVSDYEMKFLKPVYVDTTIEMIVEKIEGNSFLLEGLVNEEIVVKGKLQRNHL